MVNDSLIYALGIGIAIGGLIFVALSQRAGSSAERKSLAIVSFSIGGAITWWFYNNSSDLEVLMREVVNKGVGILLAALAAALLFWRVRKEFK